MKDDSCYFRHNSNNNSRNIDASICPFRAILGDENE